MTKNIFACLGFALAAASIILGQIVYFASMPAQRPGRDEIVVIEPGDTLHSVAGRLAAEGMITDKRMFVLLGKIGGDERRLHVGEFLLRSDWTPKRILQELTSGTPVLHRIQVPEGLTWWKTAEVIAATGLAGIDELGDAMSDRKLLERHHIPAPTAEGYLFPDTYFVPRQPENGRAIVETMLGHFFGRVVPTVWGTEIPSPEELHQTLILASLVEKETSRPEERATVAGVYANRLRSNMLLQADPTIIYGLGVAFDGNIRRPHLQDSANPYNTYVFGGLPPGPICSPGLDALFAAKNPAVHDYYYFVARGDGSHQFSRTLAEHNKAVARYQLRKR